MLPKILPILENHNCETNITRMGLSKLYEIVTAIITKKINADQKQHNILIKNIIETLIEGVKCGHILY